MNLARGFSRVFFLVERDSDANRDYGLRAEFAGNGVAIRNDATVAINAQVESTGLMTSRRDNHGKVSGVSGVPLQ